MAEVSSVLRTPWDIFQAVTQIFPQAQATADVDSTTGRITLTTTFSEKTIVVFRNAADAKGLSVALIDLFQKIMSDQEPTAIDEHRYCCAEPLADWQTFRRLMYERNGTSCAETILQYVKDPSEVNRSVLTFLGFSPHQVNGENQVSTHDLAYFRTAFEQIFANDPDDKKKLSHSMASLFPSIHKTLFLEMVSNWTQDFLSKVTFDDLDDPNGEPDSFDYLNPFDCNGPNSPFHGL
jgi:hypothetical protein